MLMPSIFGENLFDDFFDDYFPFDTDKELHKAEKKLYGRRAGHVMKTDIKEKDNGYEFEIDLPGFAKDEVKVSLENASDSTGDACRFSRGGDRSFICHWCHFWLSGRTDNGIFTVFKCSRRDDRCVLRCDELPGYFYTNSL